MQHRSPSLVAVAAVYAVLFLASVVVPTVLAGGEHFPSPFGPPEAASSYFAAHAGAVELAAFLQLGAAMPLGIFAASATSRVEFLGTKVAGTSIGLFGGLTASALLVVSAGLEWTLAQMHGGSAVGGDAVRALHLLAFATGGPGHVVPFGLLVAGLAVAGGLQRFLPRWVMVAGIVTAGLAELSTLVFVAPAAAYLLPLARFAGIAWIILAGALLPKSRTRSS